MRVKFVWALLVVLLGIISCKSKNSHDACDGLLKLECRQEGYLCKWDPTASKCIEIIEPYSGCESLTMEGCLNNGVCQWSSFFKGGTCVSRTTGIFYSSCAEVTNLSHCQGSTCRILNGKCASSSPVDLAESCSIFTPEGCFVFGVDSGCYLNRITGKCLSATNGAEIRSCSDVQEIDYCKNKCDWFPTLDINKCQYKCEKYWFKSSCEKLTDTSGESICKWKGNTYWGTCEKPNPSLEPKEHEIDPCEGVDTENNLCKSYCSSCGNCFEGSSGKLRCLCSTQNGGLNYSEINLKSCPVNKPIQNEGGVLTCADNPENMKDCSEIQPKKDRGFCFQ